MSKKYILFFIIFWLVFQPFKPLNAALKTKVRICSVKGTVTTQTVDSSGDSKFTCHLKRVMKVTECRVVTQSTIVETGPDGWAELEYFNGVKVKVQPNTTIILEQNHILVQSGKSWFKVEKVSGGKFVVKTPTATTGIRGTEFLVNVEKDGSTNIQLIEGSIEVSDANQQSAMTLAAGMEVTIVAGSSTLKTGLLKIQKNNEWWTDWPTLVPISEMPGNTGAILTSTNSGNTLSPIADSHVYAYNYSGWNTANWGKYNDIAAGWHPSGGEKRAYLKFDLSGIDPNSFEKATLKLYHTHTGGGNSVELGVYRLLSDWTEGRGTYKPATAALPGELTWVNQPSIDRYPVVYFNPGQGINKWVEVDITSLVKAWLTGVPNYGMVIKGGENYLGKFESQYSFYSREFKEVEKRPQLILNGTNSLQQPSTISYNLLANGNFEEPLIGWYKSFKPGQNVSGWKVIDADVDLTGTYFKSSEGKQSMDLHGSPGFGGIEQTFITKPNQKYRVVFDFAGNPAGAPKLKKMRVSAAGQSKIFEFDCTGKTTTQMGWITQSWNFTANSSSTTITFATLTSSGMGNYGPAIDNVKVYSTEGQSNVNTGHPAIPPIAGEWKINQSNGYSGAMSIQKNNSGRITGSIIWNGQLKGTVDGKVSGDVIEFTISYPDGIKGLYKGTLTQNETKIINGTSKANNGTSATWNASK